SVRHAPESVLGPSLDLDILDGNAPEFGKRPTGWRHTRRDIFEPGLIGGDFDSLPRPRRSAGLLDALPPLPGEFVIVPHADERPAGAGVLKIGIGKIAFVDDAVAIERQRVMEVASLAGIRDPPNVVDGAVVTRLHLIRIFDDLVNKVAEVKHEAEL